MLAKFGDNLRIDWGYLYIAAARREVSGSRNRQRARRPRGVPQDRRPARYRRLRHAARRQRRAPALAFSFDLRQVGAATVSRHLVVAYDDLFRIEYFNRRLRPYWRARRHGHADLLQTAQREYATLSERCRQFDASLVADLRAAGGEEYARIATLAYRQTLAAHKLVADIDGTPLFFSKENFSNGCIDTVDVTYPSSPFFLPSIRSC